MKIIIWLIQILFIPVFSLLCVGVIKKIKAHLQNRIGASIFQSYKDIWKLFHKDEIISQDASWIFKYAPIIIFATMVAVGAGIPLFYSFFHNPFGDILTVIYILSLGTFFLALSGMDTGNAFGGFGSSREMTIAALSEGGFIFSLLTMGIINHTTNLFVISSGNIFTSSQSILPTLLALSGFFIVLLAETSRFPFDNPATHLELTMIHEAMILEYSGKRLALMEWAAASKLLIFIVLGANIFLPFSISQGPSFLDIGVDVAIFGMKILLFCVVIAVLESSIAKYRFFRLPDLLIVSFIINAIAISLIH